MNDFILTIILYVLYVTFYKLAQRQAVLHVLGYRQKRTEDCTINLTLSEASQMQLLSEIDLAHIFCGAEIVIGDTSDGRRGSHGGHGTTE